MSVQGDVHGENGEVKTEKLEVWHRDPVECIRELMSNPAFRDTMAYAPERVYSDAEGTKRVYDEMWTADWWWDTQVRQYCLVDPTQGHCLTYAIIAKAP